MEDLKPIKQNKFNIKKLNKKLEQRKKQPNQKSQEFSTQFLTSQDSQIYDEEQLKRI